MQVWLNKKPYNPYIAILAVGLFWSFLEFYLVYPHVYRWSSDDKHYVLVALQILEHFKPYMNLAHSFYGNDILNMALLDQPEPLYRHVLGYHFPLYSYMLALFIAAAGDVFWGAALLHGALFIGILCFTYYFALHFLRQAWVSLGVVCAASFSPSLHKYFAVTMVELLVVFLVMAAVYCWIHLKRHAGYVVFLTAVLSALVLLRYSFFVLVVVFAGALVLGDYKRNKWRYMVLVTVPVLFHYTLGANGVLFYLESTLPALTDLNAIFANIADNFSRILGGGSLAVYKHDVYQFYLYVGVAITIAVLFSVKRNPLLQLLCITHLLLLGAVFVFYDWFLWRHIRIGLWFVPFVYIFAVLFFIQQRIFWVRAVLLACVVALGFSTVFVHYNHMAKRMQVEVRTANERQDYAQKLLALIHHNFKDAAFIMVPKHYDTVSVLDSNRTYFSVLGNDAVSAITALFEAGIMFDVIFVKKGSQDADFFASQLFLTHYDVVEGLPSHSLYAFVRKGTLLP